MLAPSADTQSAAACLAKPAAKTTHSCAAQRAGTQLAEGTSTRCCKQPTRQATRLTCKCRSSSALYLLGADARKAEVRCLGWLLGGVNGLHSTHLLVND